MYDVKFSWNPQLSRPGVALHLGNEHPLALLVALRNQAVSAMSSRDHLPSAFDPQELHFSLGGICHERIMCTTWLSGALVAPGCEGLGLMLGGS
jgi:hypothetical protein